MKAGLFCAFVLMLGCGSSKPAPPAPPVAAPAEAAEVAVAPPADAAAPAAPQEAPTGPFSDEVLDTTPVVVPDAALPPPPEEAVVDCGCGCCGGVTPANACVYHAKGESLDKLRARFAKRPSAYDCRMVGCSRGTRYHYCD